MSTILRRKTCGNIIKSQIWLRFSHPMENENPRRLWCLVEGKGPVFPVMIAANEDISHLKEKVYHAGGIDPGILANWNTLEPLQVNIPFEGHTTDYFRLLRLTENDEGVQDLDSWKPVSDVWPSQPAKDKLHVFVKLPAAVTRPGSSSNSKPTAANTSGKRSRSPTAEESAAKRIRAGHFCVLPWRTWNVSGAIYGEKKRHHYFLDPAEQIQNKALIDRVLCGEFVFLTGAPASGKTTRLMRLRELLQEMDYHCFYLSFEELTYSKDIDVFWSSIGRALQRASVTPFPMEISSPTTFLDVFAKREWDRRVVLLFDELSELFRAPAEFKDDFLRTLRGMRNDRLMSAVRSIVCAGTSNILQLDTTDLSLAPFNTARPMQTPYFSIDETRRLFNMFQRDRNVAIESAIVDDIWAKTSGHPGMVCLCGEVISNHLTTLLDDKDRTISFRQWQKYPIKRFYNEISAYNTFRRMIRSLQDETAREAVKFYRSRFAGFLEDVVVSYAVEPLADFLTSEGVLSRLSVHELKYRVASPLVDALVRLRVISTLFCSAPSVSPETQTGVLDIPFVLKESLKYFDKDLIRSAYDYSYKLSTVLVDGSRGTKVPRESVYDTELMRILCNWLSKTYCWSVTPELWHTNHRVILQKDDDRPIVLDLLATEDASTVKAHIESTREHMALHSAVEGWVIHFTNEDQFIPTWQTADDLGCGVNIIHVAHKNLDFSNLSLHIYSTENGQQQYDLCV